MTTFEIAAALLVLAAVFALLNHLYLKLPPEIGLMALSLAGSLALVFLGMFVPQVETAAPSRCTHRSRPGVPQRNAVALALSIPRIVDGKPIAERDAILAMTYVVVEFSILVQGLSVGRVARRGLTAATASPVPDRSAT